jgi:hypothetical protein
MLESVNQAAAHGILRREQEGEQDHRHLVIAKVPPAFIRRIVEQRDPLIQHTRRRSSIGHSDLAFASSLFEPVHSHLASLYRSVDFRSGHGEGEIDELEGFGDGPVFVVDFVGSVFGDVIATEDVEGGVHVEEAGSLHDRFG